jgi:hypothetical protein
MNPKKIAFVVLLIAVIAVAAVFAVKRVRTEMKQAPTLYADQKLQKIDMKTLELFSETSADWMTKYAPDASGCYMNPKTGEHTVVATMKCASCGQLIPVPRAPELPKGAKAAPAKKSQGMSPAVQALLSNYMCPICRKHAWFPPSEEPAQPAKSGKSKAAKSSD